MSGRRVAGVFGSCACGAVVGGSVGIAGGLGSARGGRGAGGERGATPTGQFPDAGIEWAGIARAWSAADLASMNEELSFDGTGNAGVAFVPARTGGLGGPGGPGGSDEEVVGGRA